MPSDLPGPVLLAVLDSLADGHSLYALERDDAGRLSRLTGLYMNPAGLRLRSMTPEAFVGSDLFARYREQGNDAAAEEYVRVCDTGEPMSRVLITDHFSGPRRTFEVCGSLVCVGGTEVFSLSFRDVTHELHSRHRMRTAVQRSQELSRRDELTQLLNRRGWDRALRVALGQGGPMCLAILDLDHFKEFNDARGHPAGDALLASMAARWNAALPQDCTLARLGGEEFAVLLPGRGLQEASPLVEALRRAVPEEQTVSAGLAQRQPGETGGALMGRADEALYVAKRGGRDAMAIA